ncbi:MAG: hypothetical protein C0606_17065 [Hyphomicrobiales bacterium]|nr:MAG: hypothetical protein C0606_17065 [Hyphomicrobiales bacterium]
MVFSLGGSMTAEREGFQPQAVAISEAPATFIVADDDPILCEFAAMELNDGTVSVRTALDGLDAWDKLNTGACDLLLVDLDMPRLNGFDLIARVRSDERFANLPVVVITGREDMGAIDRAYQVGATSFVTKPLNWQLLRYQLRYVMRMSRAEADIRDARDQAQQASQVRGNILKMMRHEVHTPMNAILGFSKLLGDDGITPPSPDAIREYSGHIAEAGQRLYSTLSDIMRFAEMLSGDVDLYEDDYLPRQLIDSACQAVTSLAAQTGAKITIEDTTNGVRLACDRSQIEMALSNLLDNAICFGGEGVAIRVAASKAEDGGLVFEVDDKGPGIAPELITRCFEPFQQGDGPLVRVKEGLGLGLPIAKRIADLHSADLAMESVVGEGTVVSLHFPAARTVVD